MIVPALFLSVFFAVDPAWATASVIAGVLMALGGIGR